MPAPETYYPLSLPAAKQEIADLAVDNVTGLILPVIFRKLLLRIYASLVEFVLRVSFNEPGQVQVRTTTESQSTLLLPVVADLVIVRVYRSHTSDFLGSGEYAYNPITRLITLSLVIGSPAVTADERFFIDYRLQPSAPTLLNRTIWVLENGLLKYKVNPEDNLQTAGPMQIPGASAGVALTLTVGQNAFVIPTSSVLGSLLFVKNGDVIAQNVLELRVSALNAETLLFDSPYVVLTSGKIYATYLTT